MALISNFGPSGSGGRRADLRGSPPVGRDTERGSYAEGRPPFSIVSREEAARRHRPLVGHRVQPVDSDCLLEECAELAPQ